MTFPAKSVATSGYWPVAVPKLIRSSNSTPGWGVMPAVVVVVMLGTRLAGSAPVVKVKSESLKEEPSANWITPRMW